MSLATPTPAYERAGEALKTALQAIVADGAKYSFTPSEVAIVEDLDVSKLDPNNNPYVLWILEGDIKPTELASEQEKSSNYFSIFAAYHYAPDDSPTPPPAARKTIRNLIASDIRRAIMSDVRLGMTDPNTGASVVNTEVTEFSRDIRIDSTTEWVALSAFVVVDLKEMRYR